MFLCPFSEHVTKANTCFRHLYMTPPHSSLYSAARWCVSKVVIKGWWLFRRSVCDVSRVTCRGAPLLLKFSMVVMALLLLRGGDVESNPGPETPLKLDDLGRLKRCLRDVSAYWVPLADQLEMTSQVANIRGTPDNIIPSAFMRDLLIRWLSREHPSPTLEVLCQALRNDDEIIGGADAARKLEELFLGVHNSSQHPGTRSSQYHGVSSSHWDEQCISEHPEETNRKIRCYYANLLRDKYRSVSRSFLSLQWPPPPTQKVFNLAMVTQEGLRYGPNEEVVKLLLRGDVSGAIYGKDKIQLENISASLHPRGRYRPGHKIFLIEGAPGAGKSTMAWHMCQMWERGELFEEFEIVLFVQLRDPTIQSAQSLEDLFPDDLKMKCEVVHAIQYCDGHQVLIVLDGWDEFPPGLDKRSVIKQLIRDPSSLNMKYSALIITSRPIATAELQHHATHRIEIVGFMPTEVEGYFAEAIGDPHIEKKLKALLKERPVIEACCYLPMNAAIITHVFLASNYTLPSTLHGVFVSVILCCIRRHLTKQAGEKGKIPNLSSLNNLPEDLKMQLKHICLLAYRGVRENKVTFSTADISSYRLPTDLCTLCLIQGVESFAIAGEFKSYNFLHLSVQELLAAFHISEFPPAGQVKIFNELFEKPRFSAVFQFYAAFTKLQSEGVRNVVARIVQRKSKLLLLSLLRCLYEARDASLCKFVAAQLNGELNLSKESVSPLDCLSIGYFLNTILTTCGEFNVNLNSCRLNGYSISLLCKELFECSGTPAVGAGVEEHLRINLPENEIGDGGAKCLGEALRVNHNLLTLNLNNCEVTSTGAIALGKGLQQKTTTLEELHLRDNEIGDGGAESLGEALRVNHSLKTLNLNKCYVTTTGAIALGKGLQENTTLEILDLENNSIGNGGAGSLGEALRVNRSLKTLHLEKNRIGDGGVGSLGEALRVNHSLKTLYLNNCEVTSTGAIALGKGLQENTTLEILDLELNRIGDGGAKSLGEALSVNHSLKTLNLLDCCVTSTGAIALCKGLQENTTLEILDLGEDWIGDGGAESLGEALRVNHSLKTLNLYNCEVTSTGSIALGKGLQENTTLEILHLGGNRIGGGGAKSLGEALRVNHSLKALYLNNCSVTSTGAIALGKGLQENTTLEVLNLGEDWIGECGAKSLGEALRVNHSLKTLHLGRNVIGDGGAKSLGKALRVNDSLETLNLGKQGMYPDGRGKISDGKRSQLTQEFGSRTTFY